VAARPAERPTYLAPDLGGLTEPCGTPELDGAAARLGGWSARVAGGALTVDGNGSTADWWRTVAVAAWAHLDEQGRPADTAGLVPPG
jgi:glycerol-1-phosphatase